MKRNGTYPAKPNTPLDKALAAVEEAGTPVSDGHRLQDILEAAAEIDAFHEPTEEMIAAGKILGAAPSTELLAVYRAMVKARQ